MKPGTLLLSAASVHFSGACKKSDPCVESMVCNSGFEKMEYGRSTKCAHASTLLGKARSNLDYKLYQDFQDSKPFISNFCRYFKKQK